MYKDYGSVVTRVQTGAKMCFSEQPVWKLAFFLMFRLVRMNCRSGQMHWESESSNGIQTRCLFWNNCAFQTQRQGRWLVGESEGALLLFSHLKGWLITIKVQCYCATDSRVLLKTLVTRNAQLNDLRILSVNKLHVSAFSPSSGSLHLNFVNADSNKCFRVKIHFFVMSIEKDFG